MLKPSSLLFFVLIALTGCASAPLYQASPDLTNEHIKALSERENFALLGKLGFRSEEEAFSVAINNWEQKGDQYLIDLSSTFLGLGAVQIKGNPIWIEVIESGEEPIQSYYPNEILLQLLGMPLPIEHLNYWLRGLPSPLTSFTSDKDEQGLYAKINQAGWEIRFDRHQDVEGLPLPGRLKLRQDQTTITLAIKQWSLL